MPGPITGIVNTTPSDGSIEPPPETEGIPPETGGTPPTETGGTTGTGLGGKDYTALLALGIPVKCDVTSTLNGTTTTTRFYLNSKKQIRTEIPMNQGACPMMVSVLKDKIMYMGCPDGEFFLPNCDWMEIDTSKSSGSSAPGGAGGTTSPPDYQNLPATSFECEPWIEDNSKFDTPGKVCNLDDMMKDYN